MVMQKIYSKLRGFIKDINRKTVFIALTVMFAISYYLNPLDDLDLLSWNRTFSTATPSGISIDTRIGNFYVLFFLYMPLITAVILVGLAFLFKYRDKYKDSFLKISLFFALATFASYISRYTSDTSEINPNPMLQCMIAYFVMSSSMLFHAEELITYIVIAGMVLIALVAFNLHSSAGKRVGPVVKKYLYVLMWLPFCIRGALEGIYYLPLLN